MCGYTGHEFGASYPDSVCIDGLLWDADSGDAEGLTQGGELPCPSCNTAAFLAHVAEDATSCGEANLYPWCGAVAFENAAKRALRENPAAARAALADMAPFEAVDWPDREAVYEQRASWEDTVDVVVRPPDLLAALQPQGSEG